MDTLVDFVVWNVIFIKPFCSIIKLKITVTKVFKNIFITGQRKKK